ncbi:hypothetical protein GCM10010442_01730 [Kitasatospora kifunensis]
MRRATRSVIRALVAGSIAGGALVAVVGTSALFSGPASSSAAQHGNGSTHAVVQAADIRWDVAGARLPASAPSDIRWD